MEKISVIMFFVWLIIVGFGITGYIKNVVKLTKCDFEPSYKAEVIHGIGLIPPVGCITGWINVGK